MTFNFNVGDLLTTGELKELLVVACRFGSMVISKVFGGR
jgi:hypothetical protein